MPFVWPYITRSYEVCRDIAVCAVISPSVAPGTRLKTMADNLNSKSSQPNYPYITVGVVKENEIDREGEREREIERRREKGREGRREKRREEVTEGRTDGGMDGRRE